LPSREQPDDRYHALKEMGDCHAALADYPKARQYYLQALALARNEAGPYVGLGAIAMGQGQLAEAIASFNLALAMDDASAQAYGGLAMAYQQLKQYPKAQQMYLKCLELDSDNLIALLGLFQTSCQMGTFARIIHYLELYFAAHPDDTAVLFCLATLYAREGELAKARQALLTVLALEPAKPEATQLLAQVQRAYSSTAVSAVSGTGILPMSSTPVRALRPMAVPAMVLRAGP
jgi:tetratricopeptide (TPR) repeat protein